jgi:transcriptional regulator with XRE-family HTH domain
MRFRELIKQKLEVEGVPRDVLAREIGVPNTSLTYYIRENRQPRKASLDKLARYFGESPARLLEDDGQDVIELMENIRPLDARGKTVQEKRLLEDFRRADRIDRLMILRMAELAAGRKL